MPGVQSHYPSSSRYFLEIERIGGVLECQSRVDTVFIYTRKPFSSSHRPAESVISMLQFRGLAQKPGRTIMWQILYFEQSRTCFHTTPISSTCDIVKLFVRYFQVSNCTKSLRPSVLGRDFLLLGEKRDVILLPGFSENARKRSAWKEEEREP